MNLVWHQLRKDVRQCRVFLGIWGGLVLLDLAVSLGWVGRVSYLPRAGFDQISNTWTGLLPTVLWAFVGLLPSLVVLADSPARREGFLAARPLPMRDLLLAKLLFVLGLVVAPWTLQELVHLTFQGMPGWVIAQGTVERLLVALPVAVGFGAYAALWPGYARWARALAISVLGAYLLALAAMAVNWFVLHSRTEPFDFSFAAGIVGVYGCTSALVLLAVWHARVHPGVLGRWGGLVVVALCYWLTGMLCPRDFLTLRPADPPTAKSVMADVGFGIPRRSMSFQKQHNPDRVQFTVNLAPRTKPLPAGLVVEWSTQDASLRRTAGGTLPGGVRGGRTPLFHPQLWNPSYLNDDFAAWASVFPEDVLFRVEDHYLSGLRRSMAHAGRFDLPTGSEELAAPLTLHVGLEARIFRWRKLADLPLKPGATATDEFGSWEYIATGSPPSPLGGQLHVRRRQIELATARDSRCSTAYYGPLGRQVFMVFDPQRRVAWLPQSSGNSASRATHTALAERFVTLYFQSRKPFTSEELARCRLLVFEKTWLGSVPETWQSPAFTLAEMLPVDGGVATGVNEPMPRAEFLRRIAALKTPTPDAARRDVSLYLLEFLRLVDARRRPLELSDPLTAHLARFVPAHLDLLLDGLPVMNWTSKRCVLQALQLGATDAQKPALIAALVREPELAGVVFERGWVDDARAGILHLADKPRSLPLPLSALRAIAWFREPQTYPRLLDEFELCQEWQYEVLRTLPGLEPQLAEIIHRRWREESLVVSSLGSQQYELFQLAMQLGETNALQRAFQLLDDPDFNVSSQGMQLANALRSGVQMSGLTPEKRHDDEAVLAWMRTHRPEEFVFDLARRQYVLKENLAVREPGAAQKP